MESVNYWFVMISKVIIICGVHCIFDNLRNIKKNEGPNSMLLDKNEKLNVEVEIVTFGIQLCIKSVFVTCDEMTSSGN